MGCRWLLLVLLSDVSLCPASDTVGDEGAADTAAAGLVAQMIKALDVDGDGKVSRADLRALAT